MEYVQIQSFIELRRMRGFSIAKSSLDNESPEQIDLEIADNLKITPISAFH